MDVTPRERQGPGKGIPGSYWYISYFPKQRLLDAAKQNIERNNRNNTGACNFVPGYIY